MINNIKNDVSEYMPQHIWNDFLNYAQYRHVETVKNCISIFKLLPKKIREKCIAISCSNMNMYLDFCDLNSSYSNKMIYQDSTYKFRYLRFNVYKDVVNVEYMNNEIGSKYQIRIDNFESLNKMPKPIVDLLARIFYKQFTDVQRHKVWLIV